MQEQLLLLVKLSRIDTEVHELRSKAEQLPAALSPLLRDIEKLETILSAEQKQLAETEAWVKEQEASIKKEQDALTQAKNKLQAARNERDHGAASREISNKRRMIGEREQELLKVFEGIEKKREEVAAHTEDINTLKQQAKQTLETTQAEVAELESQAAERSSGREELVAQIDKNIMRRYERVMKKRGNGVAEALDGVCQGCYMSLPPQLNNKLARLESIESCPRCTRIVYRPDAIGDAPAQSQDEAGAAQTASP